MCAIHFASGWSWSPPASRSAIVAVVVLLAAGGFQLPGYGGLTEPQRAEMDRAEALSTGPAIAAVMAFLVGLGLLVVALVHRKGGRNT